MQTKSEGAIFTRGELLLIAMLLHDEITDLEHAMTCRDCHPNLPEEIRVLFLKKQVTAQSALDALQLAVDQGKIVPVRSDAR